MSNNNSENTRSICSACGKPGEKLLCCVRCQQAWYHNKQCQLDHFPKHKVPCRQLAAAGKAAQPATKIPQPPPKPDFATVDTEGQQTLADGIQVLDDTEGELGKVCIARKEFAAGDTVLLEPPSIVFDERSGYAGLFDAYLSASKETQSKILQMYRPSDASIERHLDEKRKKVRLKRKQLLTHQYNQYIQAYPNKRDVLSFSLAEQLIGTVDANAHAFQAHHTVDIVSTSSHPAIPRTYHALFTLGSRMEHSCSPNLTFVTKGGKLEYMAETTIQPNDRLSISYLGGVYERPRKQRRGFLKENKVFLCKCTRCLGFDECSPVRCSCNKNGVMFHSGTRDQWECQHCNTRVATRDAFHDAHINKQLRGEAELFGSIRKFQHILQTQPYPEMLEEILEVVKSQRWADVLHPLHWLNVEAYKLVSSVAASAAAYHVKDKGMPPTKEPAASLTRLSALSMLRRIVWCERIVAIDRNLLSLKEACEVKEPYSIFSHKSVRREDVKKLVEELCNPETDLLKDLGTLGVSPAFHAGQDLILADQKDLALKLYTRFAVPFQHWKGISEDTRNKIKAFLDSGGTENPFGNYLLR